MPFDTNGKQKARYIIHLRNPCVCVFVLFMFVVWFAAECGCGRSYFVCLSVVEVPLWLGPGAFDTLQVSWTGVFGCGRDV
jgi:hypothetical protein